MPNSSGHANVSGPLAFAGIQAAMQAGQLLRKGFGTPFAISSKTSIWNLVTDFDKAAEQTIIEYISRQFPDHSFLAEESGISGTDNAAVQWIIDPLDGTMNFAHHIPLFAISIAAYLNHHIELGIIYQPMTDELFIAQKGRGAYLNGIRLSVSEVKDPKRAIAATGFPYDEIEKRHQSIKQFNQFLDIGNPVRIIGSAAINLAYVAAGRFDVFWSANLHPWDVAAGKLLVEEAGGVVTHYDGMPHTIFDQPSTIATNGLLHAATLACII